MINLDAELMFECLIYLNMFYFPVFGICETIMIIAKYVSIVSTPNIGRDAAVTFTKLLCELSKILLYRRFKQEKRHLITAIAVFFTLITIAALVYTFKVQDPVIKLEYMLSSLMALLAATEVVFGSLQLIHKCCNRSPYY